MTPLVLIPGMMCDARMWGRIEADLDVPVLHHIPTGAESMSDLAALFLAEAPPRFALAGLSMGGILAMEILRQAPDRVTRLALLDTNPRAETATVQARRASQIARSLSGDLEGVMREDMKPNYLSRGSGKDSILKLCMEMALSLGPQVFVRQSLALRDRPDQQTTLAAFKGPALVLMGAEDKLCPLDRHQLMHELMPQSQLRIIPGAAHLPPLEQPDATARAMCDWLT